MGGMYGGECWRWRGCARAVCASPPGGAILYSPVAADGQRLATRRHSHAEARAGAGATNLERNVEQLEGEAWSISIIPDVPFSVTFRVHRQRRAGRLLRDRASGSADVARRFDFREVKPRGQGLAVVPQRGDCLIKNVVAAGVHRISLKQLFALFADEGPDELLSAHDVHNGQGRAAIEQHDNVQDERRELMHFTELKARLDLR